MLDGLLDYLTSFLLTFWEFLLDLFYWVCNTSISLFSSFLVFVSGLLPVFDFDIPSFSSSYPVVQCLNWCFPVSYLLGLFSTFCSVVVFYFTVGIILRWAKVQ